MQLIETAHLNSQQKESIYILWNQEYPAKWSDKASADLGTYLNNFTHKPFIYCRVTLKVWKAGPLTLHGKIKGGSQLYWIAKHMGKALILLNKLKAKEQRLSGWVVDHNYDVKQDGNPYKFPLKFYEKNGFTIRSGIRLETEKLLAVKYSLGTKLNLPATSIGIVLMTM